MYTDGLRYLEKAPLMYWGLAASYELFGISDWSTRLPPVLATYSSSWFWRPTGSAVMRSVNAEDSCRAWSW